MKRRPKVLEGLEKLADPFLVFGIFALFLIPILTVLNLTPIKIARNDNNVLGVSEAQMVEIVDNNRRGDGISVVSMKTPDDHTSKLRIEHLTHSSGNYENLVFTATNKSDAKRALKITSSHEITDPGTEVSLRVGNKNYVLMNEDGSIYPVSIYINPEEILDVKLSIYSPVDVNFTSYMNLDIFVE